MRADRIGMMGFSAGGHLAATAGTHFDAGKADATDPIERASSRPDFLILAYPVVSFDPAIAHSGSVRNLLGENPDPKLIEDLSNDLRVTTDTPPTFLFHTNADTGVVAENSVRFYLALRRAKVPAELHIFENGPHGVGLALGDPALAAWSDAADELAPRTRPHQIGSAPIARRVAVRSGLTTLRVASAFARSRRCPVFCRSKYGAWHRTPSQAASTAAISGGQRPQPARLSRARRARDA